MKESVFDQLSRLPSLNRANSQVLQCKACDRKRAEFFDVVDFNKSCSETEMYAFGASGISVAYFKCSYCGFLFTPFFDDWSVSEFSQFVYNDDYILVDQEYAGVRPEREAELMARRLDGIGKVRILDYGSGAGGFGDRLGALGRTGVVSYDPFSSPSRPDGKFDVVTCFEVLEHTVAPRATLADIASFLDPAGCVIFSTGIQPPKIAEVRGNWWYVAPRNGHASIYTLDALAIAGQAAGLTLYSGSGGVAFAGRAPSAASERILASIGLPFRVFELAAPEPGQAGRGEQAVQWHGVENSDAGRYRWTREAQIDWPLSSEPLTPCTLRVTIPLQNEVQPGFANACSLEIGGLTVPLKREVGSLAATFALQETCDAVVKLVTPKPRRPCDLRPVSDRRFLGIAILTRANTLST